MAGIRYQKQDARYQLPFGRYQVSGTSNYIPSVRYKVLDARYNLPCIRFREFVNWYGMVLGALHRAPGARYTVCDARYHLPIWNWSLGSRSQVSFLFRVRLNVALQQH